MRAGTAIAVVAAVLVLGAAAARPVSPQPAGLRVGLVLTGGIDDPLEGMAYRALLRATRELGVQGRVLVAGPREGSAPSLAYFARRGYDLVITFGALTLDDVQAVASRYPRVKFLMLDASIRELRSSATNVRGTVFRVEEGGYLAGCLAGLVERRRPGPDAVSTIGGVKAEQVDRFIAGFRAGAREADPGIRAFNAYSGDFTVPSRCPASRRG